MSDSSFAPNFPICPCNFSPVKVFAIVQNLIRKYQNLFSVAWTNIQSNAPLDNSLALYCLSMKLYDINKLEFTHCQRAKKVVSNSPGLVDIAIRLVNSVFNLPNGQVKFVKEFD